MDSHQLAVELDCLASFLHANEPFELPEGAEPSVHIYYPTYDERDKRRFLTALTCLGEFGKKVTDYDFRAIVSFGSLKLELACERSTVCKKVKVMKEVEEWECDSILETIKTLEEKK